MRLPNEYINISSKIKKLILDEIIGFIDELPDDMKTNIRFAEEKQKIILV